MRIFLILLCFGLMSPSSAQITEVPVKFDGQIRFRSEADGRDFNTDSDINTFTLLRTQFGAKIEPLDDVDVYFEVQDSRAFGEPSSLSNSPKLDLHQAFFRLKNLWNRPLHLKVGRQEMVYGNQRLIGNDDFRNDALSLDGIKLTFGKNRNLDLFMMLIDEGNTPVLGPATPGSTAGQKNMDFRFWGAYYKHRKQPAYTLDVYGLFESDSNEIVPGENDLDRVTLGAYNKGKFSTGLDFESEFAYQFGKRQGQTVSAFMLTGSVGYAFQTGQIGRNPAIRIGYDYLSGMDADDDDYKVFDTIFANNHKFYGLMDYFVNIPINTNGKGLQNFAIKANVPFASKWNFNAHYHNFRAAKGDEKNFGNELDLVVSYVYNSVASFQFSMAFFIPGDLMEQIFANADLGVWSYTTLLVDF